MFSQEYLPPVILPTLKDAGCPLPNQPKMSNQSVAFLRLFLAESSLARIQEIALAENRSPADVIRRAARLLALAKFLEEERGEHLCLARFTGCHYELGASRLTSLIRLPEVESASELELTCTPEFFRACQDLAARFGLFRQTNCPDISAMVERAITFYSDCRWYNLLARVPLSGSDDPIEFVSL